MYDFIFFDKTHFFFDELNFLSYICIIKPPLMFKNRFSIITIFFGIGLLFSCSNGNEHKDSLRMGDFIQTASLMRMQFQQQAPKEIAYVSKHDY
jgi:hypothetical protein